MFPEPHPTAVASLGDDYVRFVEQETGTRLRWWQWVTAQRRYEIDAGGRWCWSRVWTSVMRQEGKSIELSRDGAWHGSLGRRALTLHAAHRVTTSRDVQAELWAWAIDRRLGVSKQLGDSRITWPDGSVWRTIAMESAYSQRPRRLLVDETWAMHPAPFWNALWPALSGQDEPVQALFWSCANPEDRGLAADLRADEAVCRMEWGALPGEDQADPAVWRASTAYWNPGREELMRAAVGRPGFAENWLNVWPAVLSGAARPALPGWVGLAWAGVEPLRGGVVAVDEARDGARFGVLRLVDGVRVFYRETTDLALVARLADSGDRVIVGLSMVDPLVKAGMRSVPVRFGVRELRQFTPLLQQAVVGGWLAHDHGEVLSGQAVGARLVETDAGRTLSAVRSDADVLGPKLLAWALGFERGNADPPRARIL